MVLITGFFASVAHGDDDLPTSEKKVAARVKQFVALIEP
jgi:hypothetical protein